MPPGKSGCYGAAETKSGAGRTPVYSHRMHLPSTAALAGVLLAGLAASTEPTQVARTVDAPAIAVHESAAVHPAQPAAAAPRSLKDVITDRWTVWCGNKTRITIADLADEAAADCVHGDEAAACATLIQQLNRLKNKRGIEGIDRSQLPIDGEGDADLWKRLELGYRISLKKERSIPSELFANGTPTFEAVRQAREGDCWLLATTGWMVKFRPEVIRSAIEPVGDGRWLVRFANGDTVAVSTPTVTEMITVNSDPSLCDGLWLPVVKEAMGSIIGERNKARGEIESEALRINGGSGSAMLERWTGHRVRVIRLESKASVEEVRAALVDGMKRHAAMGAGTPKEPAGAIPPNHAFAIFGFDESRDVVITWNPWNNNFAPKGPDGREHGYARKDGIAEIPLADFVVLFRGMWIETDEPARASSDRSAVRKWPD